LFVPGFVPSAAAALCVICSLSGGVDWWHCWLFVPCTAVLVVSRVVCFRTFEPQLFVGCPSGAVGRFSAHIGGWAIKMFCFVLKLFFLPQH
jgi:hypothetical protein